MEHDVCFFMLCNFNIVVLEVISVIKLPGQLTTLVLCYCALWAWECYTIITTLDSLGEGMNYYK